MICRPMTSNPEAAAERTTGRRLATRCTPLFHRSVSMRRHRDRRSFRPICSRNVPHAPRSRDGCWCPGIPGTSHRPDSRNRRRTVYPCSSSTETARVHRDRARSCNRVDRHNRNPPNRERRPCCDNSPFRTPRRPCSILRRHIRRSRRGTPRRSSAARLGCPRTAGRTCNRGSIDTSFLLRSFPRYSRWVRRSRPGCRRSRPHTSTRPPCSGPCRCSRPADCRYTTPRRHSHSAPDRGHRRGSRRLFRHPRSRRPRNPPPSRCRSDRRLPPASLRPPSYIRRPSARANRPTTKRERGGVSPLSTTSSNDLRFRCGRASVAVRARQV